MHTTEKGSKEKSATLGHSTAGKHPEGYGETSGTKVRSSKLPKKTTKAAYHYESSAWLRAEAAAWTRKAGKNSEGGLNDFGTRHLGLRVGEA